MRRVLITRNLVLVGALSLDVTLEEALVGFAMVRIKITYWLLALVASSLAGSLRWAVTGEMAHFAAYVPNSQCVVKSHEHGMDLQL